MQFIKFEKSWKLEKKYVAILYNKKTNKLKHVHFGASNYQQYKDTTGLNVWSHMDHLDNKRRKLFKQRFASSAKTKYSAGWFAYYYLW
jgi:hypothetical protein